TGRTPGPCHSLVSPNTRHVQPVAMKTKSENERWLELEWDECCPDVARPRRIFPENLHERLTNGSSPAEVLKDTWQQRLGPELHTRMRAGDLSPARAQEMAKAACLTERTLRPIVSLSHSPADQVRLVHALASGMLTPAQVKREVARLKGQERPPASTATRFWKSLRLVAEGLPRVEILAAEIATLPENKRQEMLDLARHYADLLEGVLGATGQRSNT
ncbi:MAG: hypothetical protein SXV54_16980, partial [Chloroflexota bacterium]|nr:hypothetical protein [Chloroflexota bacterium]